MSMLDILIPISVNSYKCTLTLVKSVKDILCIDGVHSHHQFGVNLVGLHSFTVQKCDQRIKKFKHLPYSIKKLKLFIHIAIIKCYPNLHL